MSTLPTIASYGNYSNGNYGAHCLRVTAGPLTIWFSYKTPVAIEAPGLPCTVRVNDWGVTTGKHMNWIDGGDKASRVSSEEFQRLWDTHVLPTLNPEHMT